LNVRFRFFTVDCLHGRDKRMGTGKKKLENVIKPSFFAKQGGWTRRDLGTPKKFCFKGWNGSKTAALNSSFGGSGN